MRWFGPRGWGAQACDPEARVPVPIGVPCLHCGELIGEDDQGVAMPCVRPSGTTMQPLHWACHLRGIVGGANHQEGNCTCCGGSEPPDPPQLSKRDAALLAVSMWRRQNP